jgi:MoaA/NifB/PqqE/SkfB family radical SAM enzyme
MTQGLWDYKHINAIHLEITNRCNAGCPMCPRYIDFGAELNPNLVETGITYEKFTKWFDPEFVKQLKRVYACGNYGDPIANKDTLPIYKYLREHNSSTLGLSMHTNGGARTPEWFYELGLLMNSSQRNDYCVFSIDGLEDTNHLYRKNTNFDKIMANVKAYREAGGIAQWDFIVFKHNEHQIETARQLAKDLGFTVFNVKRTTRWFQYEDGAGYFPVKNRKGEEEYRLEQPLDETLRDENAIKIKKIKGIIPNYITNEMFAHMKVNGDDYKMSVRDPSTNQNICVDHREISVKCRAVADHRGGNGYNDEIFVSAEGEVYPCCFLGGEPNRYDTFNTSNMSNDAFMMMLKMLGGRSYIDLHNKSLREIIESDLYQRLLPSSFENGHNMRSRQCSSCCGAEWNKLDNGEIGNRVGEESKI